MSPSKPAHSPGARRKLEPWLHTDFNGTPYEDEELGVPQSNAHRIAVVETGAVLAQIAREAGLAFLSDQPVWYVDPSTGDQKAFSGDWVLCRPTDPNRVTAAEVVLVIEVVSVSDRRREIKDTIFQRALNEYNAVPEFGLVFPEANDPRALQLFQLDESGRYRELVVSPGASVQLLAVAGLKLRVKPQAEWTDGRKLDVYLGGELRGVLAEERMRAEAEKARAEAEKERAEAEKERAEAEKARADRLTEKLRELGIEPDEPPSK